MRKVLLGVVVLVVVLFVGLSIAMRKMSHASSPPVAVAGAPGVLMEKAGFVYEYGVKTSAGTVVLFDAGIDPEAHGVDALLAALQAKREDVTEVFVTHGHPDHIAAIPALPKATAHGGIADVDLASGKRHSAGFLPAVMRLLQAPATANLRAPFLGRQDFSIGKEKVVAIPCPGHTMGSMLYFFRGALFVGDALQYEHDALLPPPAAFTEDMGKANACISGLGRATAGLPVTTLCTGHNGCTPPDQTAALIAAAAK